MTKIVFLDASTLGNVSNLDIFKEFGEFELYLTTPQEKVIEIAKDADIIITNKVLIDKNVIDNCPNLKLICLTATGMNNVDLEYAYKKNIIVKNVSNYSTESVAQTTFALLLNLITHISYFDNYVKSLQYCDSNIFTHYGRTFSLLAGKTFGIIGLGNIGQRVAEIAQVFGCNVVYYSTTGKNVNTKYKKVDFDTLIQSSDIISVHCPLNEKTKDLIRYEHFRKMKPTAYILNLGRGGIIDEFDLARAIDENLIAGAATDVFSKEPPDKDHPLLNVKNKEKLLLTPHIAWAAIECRELLVKRVYENIKEFLKNI